MLRGCLDAIAAQAFDNERFEVVVVNNGSTDGTAALVEAESRRGRFTLVRVDEPEPGLSVARNRGAEQAKGGVLIFLDDDAVVETNWLAAYDAQYALNPQAVVQGRIIPRFEGGRPAWIGEELLARYGLLDEGNEADILKGNLHGGNFSVPAGIFRQLGGFREDLGAGRIGFGEDSDFCARARSAGFSIRYEPDALMFHMISSERATRRELLRRCYRSGRSQAMFDRRDESRLRTLCYILRVGLMTGLSMCATRRAMDRMTKAADFAERLGRAVHIMKGRRNA